MASPWLRWLVRGVLFALLGVVGLPLLAPVIRANAQGQPSPLFQATSYPVATSEPTQNPYPVDTPTVSATGAGQATVTSTAVTPTLSPTPAGTPTETLTPTPTQTLVPDVFKTEDSEMNSAQVTLVATDTPSPSLTPVLSPTVNPTQVTATAVPLPVEQPGNPVNWGLFWIGFSVPVLIACGLVLYYLDRRPDLFSPRR